MRSRVWHAVAIFIVTNLASGLAAGLQGDAAFYNSLKQPSFAPPAWLFPPMWLFLNITSLIALTRVANSSRGTRRSTFLIAEACFWVLFASFALLFFVLQSPVLGLVNTALSLVATVVSVLAIGRSDLRATLCMLPRLAWLTLATAAGVQLAANNHDPLFSSSSTTRQASVPRHSACPGKTFFPTSSSTPSQTSHSDHAL